METIRSPVKHEFVKELFENSPKRFFRYFLNMNSNPYFTYVITIWQHTRLTKWQNSANCVSKMQIFIQKYLKRDFPSIKSFNQPDEKAGKTI